VAPGEIGLFFTGSEQNVFDAVLRGLATAGATSDQELAGLPDALRDQLRIFAHTVEVPRALVAARQGLDPALVSRIKELLLGITDDDRTALTTQDGPMAWTWRFEPVTPAVEAILRRLGQLTAGVGTES